MTVQNVEAPANPGPIMALVMGHWQARMLLSAVNHGIFTRLAREPRTAADVAGEAGLAPSATHDLLAGLTHLGLLERDGDRFQNTATAHTYLVAGGPAYLGGYLAFCENNLNPAWDGLSDSLRTGRPQNAAALEGNPYDTLYQDSGATDGFLDSMDLLASPIGTAMAAYDWSDYTSFVDVGGARGHFAYQVASRNPHLQAAVFDLPALRPSFERHMADLEIGERIAFHGGDFFRDPLPTADAIVLGHVLHNWGVADRLRILRSAYDALPPGGTVFVYDPMAGGDAPQMHGVLASLTMLVWSRGGAEYSVDEVHGWLREAGFWPETATVEGLVNDTLVLGHKTP